MTARGPERAGVAYGLAAYLWWGFGPVYFKAVSHVPALEVLAHRVLWSAALLVVLMLALGRRADLGAALRNRRTRLTLMGSMSLVAVNWFVFIWAVNHGHVLQASLGYFVNPLLNVALGTVFLRERLRRPQVVAVALALVGVVWLSVGLGEPPTIALLLAGSFGFYGLLRKTVAADGMTGLTAETVMLLPAALAYLAYLGASGHLVFAHHDRGTDLLLVAAGAVTAFPLLWFANAARRLRYATVGLLQYLAPTGQFLLAVAVYGEAFTQAHLVSFAFIWAGLALYSFDSIRSVPRPERGVAAS